MINCYLKNDYIYIINSDFLSKINVVGIWDTPSDLLDYVNCSGDTCFHLDDPYPCNQKMASVITDTVIKTKILPYIQMPKDDTNNANNDFQTQAKIK